MGYPPAVEQPPLLNPMTSKYFVDMRPGMMGPGIKKIIIQLEASVFHRGIKIIKKGNKETGFVREISRIVPYEAGCVYLCAPYGFKSVKRIICGLWR